MVYNQALIFVAFAVLFGAITKLLHRYVLKETDPYAYSLVTNIISAIIFLPFVIVNFSLPKDPISYFVLGLASILWAMVSMSAFISYKGAEVSIRDPLNQSKILWALLFGVLFLGEVVTQYRIIGTVIIFLGISLLIWHPERRFGRLSEPGVRWTFGAAILSAIVAIVDKASLRWFVPEVYIFAVYFFPTIILALFIRKRVHHVDYLFKVRGKSVIIAIIMSALTYYFTIKAFSLADVTLVYPLLQLSALVAVIGGILLMKEKEHFWQKIIATIIIIVGSIIIRG